MPIRLLAHGGNTFAERARIGRWPSIHVDVLQDNYGLGPGLSTYGVGLLDREPFLILRERQKSGERFYAYTLLLDPGTEVWCRFGWNAASLASSILISDRSGDGVPGRLWSDPARLREDEFTAWLNGLSPEPRSQENGAPTPAETEEAIRNIWVSSFFGSRPILVVPAQIGLSARPDAGVLGEILDSLPEAFRMAKGWLIGGAIPHATAYGSQVVIDDVRTEMPEDTQERLARGSEVREAWSVVKASPLWEHLDRLERDTNPGRLAGRIESDSPALLIVASALRGAEPFGKLLEILLDGNVVESIFRDLIWEAAAHLSKDDSSLLTEVQTATAVRYACTRGLELPGSLQKRMQDQTLYRTLGEFGYPSKKLDFLKLARGADFEYWQSRVRNAGSDVVSAVCEALRRESFTSEQRSRLIGVALKKGEGSDRPLKEWTELKNDAQVSAWLTRQGNERLQKRSPRSWPQDFLEFGDSEPLKDHIPKDPEELLHLVHITQESLNRGQNTSNAPKVLEAVAGKGFVGKLPGTTRREIAQTACDLFPKTAWRPFQVLYELFDGADMEPISCPPETLDLLKAGLHDLIKEQSTRRDYPPPNLIALASWSGLLDKSLKEAIVKLRPDLSEQRASTRWIAGLESIGRPELQQDEAFRQIQQVGKNFNAMEAGMASRPTYSARIQELLFRDPSDRQGALNVIRAAEQDTGLREELLSAVRAGLTTRDLNGFRKLNSGDHDGLRTALFEILKEDHETGALAADSMLQGNVATISAIVKDAGEKPLNAFHLCALRYFASDLEEARVLRRKYNQTYQESLDSPDEVPPAVSRVLEAVNRPHDSNSTTGKDL